MARLTKEEKAAMKILDSVNDLGLDLDAVGIYVANISSAVLYNRVIAVAESAVDQKEGKNEPHRY
jgi:hypothetical protein